MKNSISRQLTKYLVKIMMLGIVCIVIVAAFFSVKSHQKNHAENQKSLQYFVQNVLPAAAHFMSVNDMVKLERRMDYYVENEKDRNLQIQIRNTKNEIIYQSDAFSENCEYHIYDFQKNSKICDQQAIEIAGTQAGIFYANRNIRSFYSFFVEFFLPSFVIILVLFVALIFVITKHFLKNNIVDPMNQLVQSLEQNKDLDSDPQRNKAYEWNVLRQAIRDYRKRITEYILRQQQTNSDLEREKIMSEVTSQLVYDIRSPLEALDSMAGQFPELDDKKRTLIRNATARIHNIADSLLNRKSYHQQETSLQMISSLTRSLLFEKKEQYKNNHKVTIHEYIDPSMYGVFAKIEVNDFKSILSHVIDNAVEAIEHSGFVRIALTQKNDWITIDVFDNGRGIPPEILQKVTTRGFTHQKTDGKGLGLYITDQKMREWGGRLEIESTIKSGTSIRLVFRKEEAPKWFMSEVVISDEGNYVILDDDESIHEMWEERILQTLKRNIRIHHFHQEENFEDWFARTDSKDDTTFFMDYELIGNQKSGLDVIEKFNIASRSVLVTSHYDNEAIQKKCEEMGVKIIPKELASIVPIINR